MFYFIDLDKNENFNNLETIKSENSNKWVEYEFTIVIPKDKISIGMEIAINSKSTLLLNGT